MSSVHFFHGRPLLLVPKMILKGFIAFSLIAIASANISIPGVSKQTGVTEAEMKAMLDEHNALRITVANGYKGHGPVADMLRMDFSTSVQVNAQKQASWCNGPPHGNTPGEGQNFAFSANATGVMKGAIKGWFHKEEEYYRYGGTINRQNGHFTQMIWASTSLLGCGSEQCSIGTRFVCNYKPPGNRKGKNPYKKGPPCSACPISHPYCLESLCSTAEQCQGQNCRCTMTPTQCKNGDFDGKNCSCTCGVGYTGRYCDEECIDNPQSGCYYRAKQGQCDPKSPYHKNMMENCKESCKFCKPKCVDKHKQCDLFKKGGQCNDKYVPALCAKTCGFCESE